MTIQGPFAKGAPGAAAPALPAAWTLSGILSADSSQKEAAVCQGGRAWQGLEGCRRCQTGELCRRTSPSSSEGRGEPQVWIQNPLRPAGLVLGYARLGTPFSSTNIPNPSMD